jgi:hypothetical protein
VNYTRKPDGQTVIGRYRRSDTNPLRAVTAAAGTIPIIARRTPVTCSASPEPFLSSGGGVFVGGTWVTRSSPLAAGAGLAGIDTSSCTTPRPAADWVCVKGNWLPPWYPTASGGTGTGTGGTGGSGTGGTGTATCTTIKPAANWVCLNGNRLPPWAPQLAGTGGTGTGGTGITGGTGSITCTTIKPGANWVCVKGNWLPPWYPLP